MRPFEELSKHQPTVEVEEFVQDSTRFTQPHRVYRNHIYVYPKHLKYDSQKSFAKVFFFFLVILTKKHPQKADRRPGFKPFLLANNQSQWSFCSQARNLAVYVEFRSSDDEVAKPLKVLCLRKTF